MCIYKLSQGFLEELVAGVEDGENIHSMFVRFKDAFILIPIAYCSIYY